MVCSIDSPRFIDFGLKKLILKELGSKGCDTPSALIIIQI